MPLFSLHSMHLLQCNGFGIKNKILNWELEQSLSALVLISHMEEVSHGKSLAWERSRMDIASHGKMPTGFEVELLNVRANWCAGTAGIFSFFWGWCSPALCVGGP
eukprot:scaffold27997_cov17-Tisochrysis_lutea.AAC.1